MHSLYVDHDQHNMANFLNQNIQHQCRSCMIISAMPHMHVCIYGHTHDKAAFYRFAHALAADITCTAYEHCKKSSYGSFAKYALVLILYTMQNGPMTVGRHRCIKAYHDGQPLQHEVQALDMCTLVHWHSPFCHVCTMTCKYQLVLCIWPWALKSPWKGMNCAKLTNRLARYLTVLELSCLTVELQY